MADFYSGYDWLLFDVLNDEPVLRDYSSYRGHIAYPPIDRKYNWLIDGIAVYTCGTSDFTLLRTIYGLSGYLARSPYDICQAMKIDGATLNYRRGIIMGKLKTKSDLFLAIKNGPSILSRYRAKVRKDIEVVSRFQDAILRNIEPDFKIFMPGEKSNTKAPFDPESQILISKLINIEQLSLSRRTVNALRGENICTLYDVIIRNLEAPIEKIKGIGKKGNDEIAAVIENFGLMLE